VLRGVHRAEARAHWGLGLVAVLIPIQLFFGRLTGCTCSNISGRSSRRPRRAGKIQQPATEVLLAIPDEVASANLFAIGGDGLIMLAAGWRPRAGFFGEGSSPSRSASSPSSAAGLPPRSGASPWVIYGPVRIRDATPSRTTGDVLVSLAGRRVSVMEPSHLALFWAGVIACAILIYVILDGFDLGGGVLFGTTRDEAHRVQMLDTIARFWDGNETWLMVTAAALYGAFQDAYAVFLGAFYFPVLLLLFGLIFRGKGGHSLLALFETTNIADLARAVQILDSRAKDPALSQHDMEEGDL
jgi:hypothetical protein